MSLLGKIAKGIGNVVTDAVKIGVQPITSAVSSVTGKTIDLGYSTKAGSTVGGVTKVGVESGNTLFKSFADTATGGLASKGANLLRKDEFKESPGNYYETRTQTFTSGPLQKFEAANEKASVVVGSLAATVLKSKQPAKPTEFQPGKPPISELLKPASNQNMGLLNTLTQGINKIGDIAKTPIGQQATGILGGMVQNLLTPKKPAPSTTPQQLALNSGTPSIAESTKLTTPQAALFGGGGAGNIGIDITGLPGGAQPTWWDKNKSWAMPVSIVLGALAALLGIISFFTRKRR